MSVPVIGEDTMTQIRCWNLSVFILLAASLSPAPATAQGITPSGRTPAIAPSPTEFQWCHQVHRPIKCDPSPSESLLLAGITEIESNDTVDSAQNLPLGAGSGQDADVDVHASLSSSSDVDFYSFSANKGDIIGIACVADTTVFPDPANLMDSIVTVLDANGVAFFENDQGEGVQSLYPDNSPWPAVTPNSDDSALTFVVPTTGDYVLKVRPWISATIGGYTLKIRNRRAFIETFESPARQTIFIDFDGATIDVAAIFGSGSLIRTLSPLSSFLGGWGLTTADQNAVIDAVMFTIQENFDSMRLASLNNDLRAGGPLGSFDIEFRNSRDDPDPFGAKNVSRIIVGGTQDELLIPTVGIAQSIDPGNYNTKETGVVLLDLLSGAATGNSICCSLNDIPVATGASKINLIGVAIGNIVSHEIGHYLGNFHTTNQNAIVNLMDEGGQLLSFTGAGPNGVFGDNDDVDVDFVTDTFSGFEGVGFGDEITGLNTAFGLATGKLAPVPPTIFESVPPKDTNIGKLPQLTITFSEPIVGISASQLLVNGTAAQFVSGTGAGPYLFSGFPAPPDGDVTCALAAGGIKDQVGNPFAGGSLAYTIKDCNRNGILDDDDITGGTSKDCNGNQVADDCDESVLRSRSMGPIEIQSGKSIALGDFAPFLGGDPPYSFKWTIRGNPGGETSTDLNAVFGPLPPDTYVPELEVTDANGCKLVGFLTIKVIGEDGTDGGTGTPGNPDSGNNGGSSFGGNGSTDCGQGSACGVSGGGLMMMVCAYFGLLGYRRQRK
jgi:hypothetical protein